MCELWVRDDGELMSFKEFVIVVPRLFLVSALIVLWHLSLTVFMKGKQNWYEKSIACHILRAHDIFELLANWAQTALCFRNLLLRYWHDIFLALWEYFNTGLLYYQSAIGWWIILTLSCVCGVKITRHGGVHSQQYQMHSYYCWLKQKNVNVFQFSLSLKC